MHKNILEPIKILGEWERLGRLMVGAGGIVLVKK